MNRVFLCPHLEGVRFDEHSLPLDSLKDWAVFEELVIETARWIFLKKNPNRRRVPRGFTDALELRLTRIETGSSVPVIERRFADSDRIPAEDYFDQARDLILQHIKFASEGKPKGAFPDHLDSYFDRFGRNLRADEKIMLGVNSQSDRIQYDRSVRKRLILRSANEYRSQGELEGFVFEIDRKRRQYSIELLDGSQVGGSYPPELGRMIVWTLAEEHICKVRVDGIVLYDQDDKPKKIEKTLNIEILEPNDVPSRIRELAKLEAGWLDGGGDPLPSDGLEWLEAEWKKLYHTSLPAPYLYPTPEGNIQAEWSAAPWEVSALIDLEAHSAELMAVNIETLQDFDTVIVLETNADWRRFADFVSQYTSQIAPVADIA